MRRRIRPDRLNQLHINHIVSAETLKRQVGMTLAERAADFIRSFPLKKTSPTTLNRIYKRNNVRKKKVKVTKVTNRKE